VGCSLFSIGFATFQEHEAEESSMNKKDRISSSSNNNSGAIIIAKILSPAGLLRFLVVALCLAGFLQIVLLIHVPAVDDDHHHRYAGGGGVATRQQQAEIWHILQCPVVSSSAEAAADEEEDDAVALFCQAARYHSGGTTASSSSPNHNKNNNDKKRKSRNHYCDPDTEVGRHKLLTIWQMARDQIDNVDLLRRALSLARSADYTLMAGGTQRKHNVTLWAPPNDIGITTVLAELNNNGYGMTNLILPTLLSSLTDPAPAAGSNITTPADVYFVDIGANLGIISLAVALETMSLSSSSNNNHQQHRVQIITIEAAAPTWLYQLLNLRCNLENDDDDMVTSILAGLDDVGGQTLSMTWREHSTTSTRSWTPESERRDSDIELQVPTRTLRSILDALPPQRPYRVAVMKVDCEGTVLGSNAVVVFFSCMTPPKLTQSFFVRSPFSLSCLGCEYNVIPALSEKVRCERNQPIGFVTG
jgi:hypothetical protein